MQRSLAPIIAGCVAALVFTAPKPASAMTAPAVHYGETDAGIVQPVKKGGYNKGYYRGRGHKYGHYRNYGSGTTAIGATAATVAIPIGAVPVSPSGSILTPRHRAEERGASAPESDAPK